MPIEIREIGIRLRLAEDDEALQPGGEPAQSGGCNCTEQDRAIITEDCVRRVLAILQAQRDR